MLRKELTSESAIPPDAARVFDEETELWLEADLAPLLERDDHEDLEPATLNPLHYDSVKGWVRS